LTFRSSELTFDQQAEITVTRSISKVKVVRFFRIFSRPY